MTELELISPLSGKFLSIEQVPDEVFSSKSLGDGVGIDPSENLLSAPCDGKISYIHKSCHALTIINQHGQQVLLHIGINTVNLKGDGFKVLVKEGQDVRVGDALIEFDRSKILAQGLSPISVMLLLHDDKVKTKFRAIDETLLKESQLVCGQTTLAHVFLDKEFGDQSKVSSIKASKAQKPNDLGEKSESLDPSDLYESAPILLRLPSGMHARPAGQLAELSKKFKSYIEIIKGNQSAHVSSMISVLGLEIEREDEIKLVGIGKDAKEAVHACLEYLIKREEEEIQNFEKEHSQETSTRSKQLSDERTIVGVGASQGLVIGKVKVLKNESFEIVEQATDSALEKSKLEQSLNEAEDDILALEESMTDKSKSAIFAAHREMLKDPEILQECMENIARGKTAAFSWNEAINHRVQRLESLKNELIQGRANDMRDVGERVLRSLLGLKKNTTRNLSADTILIAQDLTPSDLVQIEKQRVLGFCTTTGGATSHVAILARSMGIAAIAGIEERALDLRDGEEVILDGDLGVLKLNPTQEEREIVKEKQAQFELKEAKAKDEAFKPAITQDGFRVEVVANIAGPSDAHKSVEVGGEGVGLLRSEFLFLDRDVAPSMNEQKESYQQIADALGDKTLVIRTLDIGGDKELKYLPGPFEENPFLGVRGIRLCLKKENLFREQLRAILSVQSSRPINIMFPMIGQLSELRQAKAILKDEQQKLNAPKVHIGMMIEVPSAVIMADQFAREVDFFSIGTNDLTQYTLAMDRGHNELAKSVDGMHPAVLKMIHMATKAAHRHKKWVGVCGGLASEPKAIPLLVGMGIEELSLSIPKIPQIKSIIRELSQGECEKVIDEALEQETGDDVRELVMNKWPSLF